jgi:ABC-type lipoprotein export system ATPase subunit
MALFCELNRQGTTIVQVTHSEENAHYSKRIVELRDGWLTRDEQITPNTPEVGAK